MATIAFVLFCAAQLCLELTHLNEKYMTLIRILGSTALIYGGIVAGALLAGAPESVFWVSDSVITHVPMVDQMVKAIQSGTLIEQIKPLAPGTTTHIFTAFCFILFGKSTYSSLIALMILKCLAAMGIFFLTKELYHRKAAYFSSLLYILSPTVLFYTITLYKEAAVQAFVAWILYFFVLFYRKHKSWAVIPFLVLLGMISFERIYLPWLILPSLFVLTMFGQKRHRLLGLVLATCGFAIMYLYTPVLKRSPTEILATIEDLRQAQMAYTDYSFSFNYEIPYPLAVLKAFFTPFFTPVKFAIFSDFSYLLIWGSFVNQAILLAFLWQWVREFKKERLFHFMLTAPFFVFVLLLAYIAPWSGRIRDSFYPLVTLYAGVFFCECHWKAILAKIRSALPIGKG